MLDPGREIKPREGGEVETTEISADRMQREPLELWRSTSRNGIVKTHAPERDVAVVNNHGMLQLGGRSRESG